MNYVPLEFMDSVAATLRHLPSSPRKADLSVTHDDFSDWKDALDARLSFKGACPARPAAGSATLRHLPSSEKLRDSHDDFAAWKDAINQARLKRMIFTMEITENNANSSLRIAFCHNSNSGLKKINFDELQKLDKSSIQIHEICVNSGDLGFNDTGTVVRTESEFQEIIDAICPLTNCASLIISGAIAKERPAFNYLPMLHDCNFWEITSTTMCPSLGEELMTKQMTTGILANISTWPTGWSNEFTLNVEEFLVSQQYNEVELPYFYECKMEFFVSMFDSPCGSEKKIYFYCSEYSEDFEWKREDGVKISFQSLYQLTNNMHHCLLSFVCC